LRALNFYSSVYHVNILAGEKHCTIRLGDKTSKYAVGDLVWVTHGDRFRPRKKLCTAVLDKVTVKTVSELTPEDLQGENPDMKTIDDAMDFLKEIYMREISPDELVTVIYFSEVVEG